MVCSAVNAGYLKLSEATEWLCFPIWTLTFPREPNGIIFYGSLSSNGAFKCFSFFNIHITSNRHSFSHFENLLSVPHFLLFTVVSRGTPFFPELKIIDGQRERLSHRVSAIRSRSSFDSNLRGHASLSFIYIYILPEIQMLAHAISNTNFTFESFLYRSLFFITDFLFLFVITNSLTLFLNDA